MVATDRADAAGVTGERSSLSFNRIKHLLIALGVFLVAFVPRAVYPVTDTSLWHTRGRQFLEALATQNWVNTWTAPHPGVTLMWLVAAVRWLGNRITDYAELSGVQQYQLEILPVAFILALGIALSYLIMRRIFGEKVALASALLLALDPFHLFVSKILHPDALMSVLMMVSALFLFLYMKEQKARYVIFSGALAALAILSKTPALFMIPYFALWLGVWQLTQWQAMEPRPSLFATELWRKRLRDVLAVSLLWFLPLIVVVIAAWPAMWVEPQQSIARSLSQAMNDRETAHFNPIYYLGRITNDDPGWSYYPLTMALNSTLVTLPLFALSLLTLIRRRTNGIRRIALWLSLAFLVFFTLQMGLGAKKFTRYVLPAMQFIPLLAGFAAVQLAERLRPQSRTLPLLMLVGIVGAQAAIALPRHPHYGTHFNRLFGTPYQILEDRGIVPGQEAGEGLDLAAAYLNRHPFSGLLVVGTQHSEMFGRYFEGKAVELSNDNVDYVVFMRNWTIRGLHSEMWGSAWERYKDRRPKHVVEFDGVPYVWVFKTGPVVGDEDIPNRVDARMGDTIRLLGYGINQTMAQPGDTLHVTLYWEASAGSSPSGDYTVFVHLLDPSGNLHAQQDSKPQNGMHPTFWWDAGERVMDEYEIVLPGDLPPGTYSLNVGMYTLQTLERLPITSADGASASNGSLTLVEVKVEP